MKTVIRFFYLFYICLGGYRNYVVDYSFYKTINDLVLNIPSDIFLLGENILFFIALYLVGFPFSKKANLFFFIILFAFDIYFENFIKFDSSLMGIHIFPLISYLFLNKFSKSKVTIFAILFLTVGFTTSFYQKIRSGWFNLDDFVIYSYLVQFAKGFNLNLYLAEDFLTIKSKFFWKLLDYFVIIFQGSFLINFITTRYLLFQFAIAIFFHLGILLSLNIGLFFPYMLLYLLIISYQYTNVKVVNENYFYIIALFVLAVFSYILFPDLPHFFYEFSSFKTYIYFDFYINVIVVILASFVYFSYYKKLKTLFFNIQ